MNVIWTDNAILHLAEVFDYIARDSPQYAARMVDRITARSKQLSTFPESGEVVPEYGQTTIREIIEGPYRVIDRMNVDCVEVLAVIHGARLLPPDIG